MASLKRKSQKKKVINEKHFNVLDCELFILQLLQDSSMIATRERYSRQEYLYKLLDKMEEIKQDIESCEKSMGTIVSKKKNKKGIKSITKKLDEEETTIILYLYKKRDKLVDLICIENKRFLDLLESEFESIEREEQAFINIIDILEKLTLSNLQKYESIVKEQLKYSLDIIKIKETLQTFILDIKNNRFFNI